MRRLLFLALFVFALAAPAFAQDAVKVDPKHYKVESQDARVRILRIHYGPHEKSVMHRHPATVVVFLTDGKMKFTYPGGRTEEREVKAGQAVYNAATTHLPENLSDQDMEAILIEFKARKAAPKKPADSGATTTTTPPKKQ
jgi:quercetin dioxygenase-like cupin family protein